jgi:tRNA (guanine-N7-)-methyltransferase
MDQDSPGAQFRGWKNQYIDLVDSKTERIISLTRREPSAEEKATLAGWIQPYKEIYCEVGSGSGGHLIELAARSPEAAFIGFELRFKRAFRTVEKAEARGIKNLFLIRADAATMRYFFAPQSLNGVYVNFPDPWAKARWKKNRILSAGFLNDLSSLLCTGGFLSYKTDHAGYFEDTVETLRKTPSFEVRKLTKDFYASPYIENNVASEFENLFVSKSVQIHYLFAVILGKPLHSAV